MDAEDREAALWAAEHHIDFLGLSFVRDPRDVAELKALLATRPCNTRVIAKIEKQEAIDQLDAIVEIADGIMVARGDLGVEIDVAKMPVVQKHIVATCRQHQKPVIIATQMLDSMQHSRQPTRAETTDVANAILDGGDACMLSGETAIGKYPRESVAMMNRIALATEELFHDNVPLPPGDFHVDGLQEMTAAIVYGAGQIAAELEARLVVVASHTGATAPGAIEAEELHSHGWHQRLARGAAADVPVLGGDSAVRHTHRDQRCHADGRDGLGQAGRHSHAGGLRGAGGGHRLAGRFA